MIRSYKGLIELVETCARLRDQGLDFHLIIAGDPYELEYSERLAEVMAAYEWAHLLPYRLSAQEVASLVSNSSILIAPYLHLLNSGVVLLGLSYDRPVVAPYTGALPELRERVGKQWLYLYEDDLAAAIEEALSAPASTASPNLTDHAWDRIGETLAHFVNEQLGGVCVTG